MRRAIIIVLDSVGIGELPDAGEYGDIGSNTLVNIKKAVPGMDLKNLNSLGLSSIDGGAVLSDMYIENPAGAFCKLAEASKGKDTTIGHWEIAGIITEKPFPTYPDGFPTEIITRFENEIGRKTIGNTAASGTEIIERLGDEHVRTGFPIVYTSADSVFQIAMHEGIIPIERQYEISKIALGLTDVARVITRPFIGESGRYRRTANRHDFSVEPTTATILDHIKNAGLTVAAVGKIADIFANKGITRTVPSKSNSEGVERTLEMLAQVDNGLIFTNLVDFDMLYGHRNDPDGYAAALKSFDMRIPELLEALKPEDMLFITADHGCDPVTPSTDHSREYVPLIVCGACVRSGTNLHIRSSFADIGATVLEYLNIRVDASGIRGESFLKDILR